MHILLSSHIVSYKCQVPIELQSIDINRRGIHLGEFRHGPDERSPGTLFVWMDPEKPRSAAESRRGIKTISLASIEYLPHRRISPPNMPDLNTTTYSLRLFTIKVQYIYSASDEAI